MDIINELLNKLPETIQAILIILGFFSVIAKATPTKFDDNLIAKLINLIGLAKKK